MARKFWRPRLVQLPPDYLEIPGQPWVSRWKDPRPTIFQRAKRAILSKRKQAISSAPGLSKLPYELLDIIFRELCGREVHSIRLVCTDWELASRPFFAANHLTKSAFCITSADLKMLDRLSQKFRAYMERVFITSDSFTIAGVWEALTEYTRLLMSDLQKVIRNDATANSLVPTFNSMYAGDSAQSHLSKQYRLFIPVGAKLHSTQYLTLHNRQRAAQFLMRYTSNAISQLGMRVFKHDIRILAEIFENLYDCEVKVVDLNYDAESLHLNREKYGKAVAGIPAELSIFLYRGDRWPDHAKDVVEEARSRQRLLSNNDR